VKPVDLDDLVGKTILEAELSERKTSLLITTKDYLYVLLHEQDCGGNVTIYLYRADRVTS